MLPTMGYLTMMMTTTTMTNLLARIRNLLHVAKLSTMDLDVHMQRARDGPTRKTSEVDPESTGTATKIETPRRVKIGLAVVVARDTRPGLVSAKQGRDMRGNALTATRNGPVQIRNRGIMSKLPERHHLRGRKRQSPNKG